MSDHDDPKLQAFLSSPAGREATERAKKMFEGMAVGSARTLSDDATTITTTMCIPAGRSPRERHYSTGYVDGFAAARERAALLVQPEPKAADEERECSEVAVSIRALKPWPAHPEYDCIGDDGDV